MLALFRRYTPAHFTKRATKSIRLKIYFSNLKTKLLTSPPILECHVQFVLQENVSHFVPDGHHRLFESSLSTAIQVIAQQGARAPI